MKPLSKFTLIFFFISLAFSSYSQRHKKPQNLPRYDFKKIHFGFTLGINSLNFHINKNNDFLINDTLLIIALNNVFN